MRNRGALWNPLMSLVVLALGAADPFVSPVSAAEDGQPGRQLYLRYCSACHGPEAKGDGVAGTLMRPSPADLTLLASKNGGEFPMERVVRNIDGREALRAHGEPAMPVWGEVLSAEYGSEGKQRPPIERRVQGRILSIVDYLRSIQVK
jgi:mono/diheme cytochrome c family protein